MKKAFFLTLLVAYGMAGNTQQNDSLFIRKLADRILTDNGAYTDLYHLTKDVGPRLAGSPGMVKAEEWGRKTMQLLQPDNVWLQECMVPHWVRGGKDRVVIKPANGKQREVDVLALGNSIGTGGKPISAPVLLVNDFDELESRKDEVKGKIVFYNYHFNPTFINTFDAYGDAVKYRGQGPSRAARYGAVGVIIRSMSHGMNNVPHTGATRYDTTLPKIPAVAVGLEDADWLAKQSAQGTPRATLQTNGHFLPDTIGHNVIAELKGSEFPDEFITIGGHLDSWDVCEGAQDDGAGIVQTIEILRAFREMGYTPKHSIRFVLFMNEENGLRGGSKYAAVAKEKGEKHIFALESDEGGFTPRGIGLTGSAEQLQKIASWNKLIASYGASELRGGGGGADIGPLNQLLGTPTANVFPDSQRYFDFHHARNDVFEAVNKRELELGAVNMAILVYLVDQYGL